MKKFKKTMSVLAVALIAALGIGGANVGATSWAVSHANYSGAPSSEGVAKSIIVKQRAKGATERVIIALTRIARLQRVIHIFAVKIIL